MVAEEIGPSYPSRPRAGSLYDVPTLLGISMANDGEVEILVGCVAERAAGERRVGIAPAAIPAMLKAGARVGIEPGAGRSAGFTDEAYTDRGAELIDRGTLLSSAAVLCQIHPIHLLDEGAAPAAVIGLLDPLSRPEDIRRLAEARVTAYSLEMMPRITRAQSMDVLSSQANLAGYKAVVDAAAMFDQAMPMMMTAAGTVPAAKAFIMGVGVAGLQAIATARRMGAQVTATDVRPATKEQVASLGAKFVAVEDEEFKQAQTAAGYAKPMSAEYQKKQAELVASHIKNQDIVITTALIPGRPAPRLITRAMVESMKSGAIIVDLAAERGGNCELTKPGEVIEHNGVRIFGPLNLAGEIPVNASSLYARNLLAFLDIMIDKTEKVLKIDWDDEIVKGTLVAKDGKIVHPSLQPQGAA